MIASSLHAEIKRRQSLKEKLKDLFLSNPGRWISITELAQLGGVGGFRTRISELRLEDGLHIEHNGKNGALSAHRYLPYEPISTRDVSEPMTQPYEQPLPGIL